MLLEMHAAELGSLIRELKNAGGGETLREARHFAETHGIPV